MSEGSDIGWEFDDEDFCDEHGSHRCEKCLVECEVCEGDGSETYLGEPCSECQGSGMVYPEERAIRAIRDRLRS